MSKTQKQFVIQPDTVYTLQIGTYATAKALIAIAAMMDRKEQSDGLWPDFFGSDALEAIAYMVEVFVDEIGVDAAEQTDIDTAQRVGRLLLDAAENAQQARNKWAAEAEVTE